MTTHEEKIVSVEKLLQEVTSFFRKTGEVSTAQRIWQDVLCYSRALFDRHPIKEGSRVELLKTPVITKETAPGWMGAKHFLVAGVKGTVRYVDFSENQFLYLIAWDNQTWISPDGSINPLPAPAQYIHGEGKVKLVTEDPQGV